MMLRITVEIVPGGTGRAREIAVAVLGNVSDLARFSDYTIAKREGPNAVTGAPQWESRGLIAGHDRVQSVWVLVQRAASWAAAEASKNG